MEHDDLQICRVRGRLEDKWGNRESQRSYGKQIINFNKGPRRRVIKHETKSKTFEEIREPAIDEKEKLLTILNKDQLHKDLIEDLILFDEPPIPWSFIKEENRSIKFLEDIEKLQDYDWRKGSRYSKN